jgi:hypothetical protein
MSFYISQLKAAAAIEQAQREEKQLIATKAAGERLTPLEVSSVSTYETDSAD